MRNPGGSSWPRFYESGCKSPREAREAGAEVAEVGVQVEPEEEEEGEVEAEAEVEVKDCVHGRL